MKPAAQQLRLDSALEAAQQNTTLGFTNVYELLAGEIAAFCRARLGDDIDDLVNEIFLGAFRGLSGFDGNGKAFRSYVYRIARNKIADRRQTQYHHNRRHQSLDETQQNLLANDVGPEISILSRLDTDDVRRLLDRLTDDQREVMVLRFLAEMTIAEVAEVTDRTQTAVKALQRRAVSSLRRSIGGSPEVSRSRRGRIAPVGAYSFP